MIGHQPVQPAQITSTGHRLRIVRGKCVQDLRLNDSLHAACCGGGRVAEASSLGDYKLAGSLRRRPPTEGAGAVVLVATGVGAATAALGTSFAAITAVGSGFVAPRAIRFSRSTT